MSNEMEIIKPGSEGLFSFWYRSKGYGYFETQEECEKVCRKTVNEKGFNKSAFTLPTFIKLGDVNKGKILLVGTIWV